MMTLKFNERLLNRDKCQMSLILDHRLPLLSSQTLKFNKRLLNQYKRQMSLTLDRKPQPIVQ